MMRIAKQIKSLAAKNHKKVVEIRRHLHMYPELSFEEKKTGKYISDFLRSRSISHTKGWVGTGVVGIINPEKAHIKSIALRADIDALPIHEANKIKYKSKNIGVMHACGHDVHSASLCGAAMILDELKAKLNGSVKLIFQPGEEKLPGGASLMIKEGVLRDPVPSSVYGQHVHPPLEVGKVGLKGGPYMASADEIFITIKGVGGHGALPQDCIDPILISAYMLTSIQQIVSRNANPLVPSVLSFGKIESNGGSTNIIPDEVYIQGTFRTMNEIWRAKAHNLIERNIVNLVESMGGKCDLEIKKGYPFLVNDVDLSRKTKIAMIEYLGQDNVVDLPIRMTSEDFSYYTQHTPSCFYRLGTGNHSRGLTSSVHTPTFNIDEKALKIGAGLMAYLAFKDLNS